MTLFDPASGPSSDRESDRVRVRLTLAYDGSGFSGFWPNAGVRTVGETLRASIEQVLGHEIALSCAGRTDAGVHAQGQVVSFDARREGLDLDGLRHSLTSMCGPELVVRDAREAPGSFDARRSATARTYRYSILNRDVPDPFLAATAWHVPTPLDLRAMCLARDPLIGEHDFSSFCRQPRRKPGFCLRRRVIDAAWHDLGDGRLRFDIEANAFCHQMVRSIVGTMVDVGRGQLTAGDVAGIIRARDREAAGDLAPPQGLLLWEVHYDGLDS